MADTADAHAANARERAWRLRRAEMTRHPLATILRANALERSAATDRAALSLSLLTNRASAARTAWALAAVNARQRRTARAVWYPSRYPPAAITFAAVARAWRRHAKKHTCLPRRFTRLLCISVTMPGSCTAKWEAARHAIRPRAMRLRSRRFLNLASATHRRRAATVSAAHARIAIAFARTSWCLFALAFTLRRRASSRL